jgi:hypothetical protein
MTFANMYGGVRTVTEERNEHDHYPTHPFATYALVQYHAPPRKIWEPAAGRGWMAWELKRNQREVYATDLYNYRDPVSPVEYGNDFLKTEGDFDGIITNPPYGKNMAQAFIERSISLVPYTAMLCRLTFAESNRRLKMFKETPPSDILIFSGRFSCNEDRWHTEKTAISGMVAYAWWIWDNTMPFQGTMTNWIDTKAMYKSWRDSLSPDDKKHFLDCLPRHLINST